MLPRIRYIDVSSNDLTTVRERFFLCVVAIVFLPFKPTDIPSLLFSDVVLVEIFFFFFSSKQLNLVNTDPRFRKMYIFD